MTAFHEVAAFHGLRNITERFAPIKPAPILPVGCEAKVSHRANTPLVCAQEFEVYTFVGGRTWT